MLNSQDSIEENIDILTFEVNPQTQELKFYWKDDTGVPFGNIGKLKAFLESKDQDLLYAMNAGMFKKDLSPVGLFVENGIEKSKLDLKAKGYGNFYLQPNGVFYITKSNEPVVCTTAKFKNSKDIAYATQSGPMLLIDGQIHEKFNATSTNLNIRNGVGVLPNGNLLFALSKSEINFYNFASFFKSKGCEQALYLDGFVSKAYIKNQNWEQLDGTLGLFVAVCE
jgi:uncharacterized protein YigE (DUF2233 family)